MRIWDLRSLLFLNARADFSGKWHHGFLFHQERGRTVRSAGRMRDGNRSQRDFIMFYIKEAKILYFVWGAEGNCIYTHKSECFY